ncbi:DUF309 domain-containing protein [Bacillus solitudinis]|uniref:DUF309 domain-containing protein n=1 Tax=Bacillus solitudinis TaxID=2014074 RepID=UPI000C23E4E0|nr:DUF309 domain-containing protein [Bacillus solitudinis]
MYPNAYLDYLLYFHGERDYFECHEVLEEHWKKQPRGKRKQHWVGLIQLAVGLYHQRRGNLNGAKRMFTSAARIIELEQREIAALGINASLLYEQITQRIEEIQFINSSFTDLNLPIVDENLLLSCQERCNQLGIAWGMESSLENEELVHKHTRRNREAVIEERQRQIQKRLKQAKITKEDDSSC